LLVALEIGDQQSPEKIRKMIQPLDDYPGKRPQIMYTRDLPWACGQLRRYAAKVAGSDATEQRR
jgi:hypothetical protein